MGFSSRFEATIVEVAASEQGLNYEVANFSELLFDGKANETLDETLDILEVMDIVRKESEFIYHFE